MSWWFGAGFRRMPSFLRWPRLLISIVSPPMSFLSLRSLAIAQWLPRLRIPDFYLVDDVLWPIVYAVESVALLSQLGFFFVFCGCTI